MFSYQIAHTASFAQTATLCLSLLLTLVVDLPRAAGKRRLLQFVNPAGRYVAAILCALHRVYPAPELFLDTVRVNITEFILALR